MGIFAGELFAILDKRKEGDTYPLNLLLKFGVHQTQIDRLKDAVEDIATVAVLPGTVLTQLRQELVLTPIEWARLQAGLEADTFLRLLIYHNYPVNEAANKANAIYSAAVKDKLATGGKGESIFPTLSERDTAAIDPGVPFHHPRGPRPRTSDEY